MTTIEYRVRPVTRYIVTEYFHSRNDESGLEHGGVQTFGEYDSRYAAARVAQALLAAKPESRIGHDSDCAVHNMPAEEAGDCDCGAVELISVVDAPPLSE